jgi:hypothetical protein
MRNIKRATVMEFGKPITPSPGQSEYLQEEEIWGEDPVHYTQKGYSLAAAGLERRRRRRMRAGPTRQRNRGWT